MSFIPIVKQIYSDETIYSWIHRLAVANGLIIKDFSNAYLGTSNASIGELPFDIRKEILPLYKNLLKKPDLIKFYLSTSTTGFEAMFMTEGQQTKMINNVFAPKNSLNTSSNGLIQTVNICPECMKEDVDTYGEMYLHRRHQLSGVATCHKHHCILHSYIGKKGHACDYNPNDYEEMKLDVDLDLLNAYTNYATFLFDVAIPCNIKVFKDVLYKKLNSNGYSVDDDYKSFVDAIDKWEYRELISFDIEHFLKIKMISADYISSENLLPVLMFLYPNPQGLIDDINNRNIEPVIMEYKCSDCNNTYITTPYAYNHQFGCHYCNMNLSEQQIFEKIVDGAGYEIKSEFKSLAKKLSLYHRECEQISMIMPRSFLYEGVRCSCETIITFKDAKKAVESSGEYKLIEFNGGENVCKIHSKSCGHTFDARYRKFRSSPFCRTCFPKNMTTEYLAERIKNTTNGEYELVGEFIDQYTKIEILHHPCGVITEYGPRYYHNGAVCPVCNNRFNEKWEQMYQLLCDYKDEFGTVSIPKRHKYKGEYLGFWCQAQRNKKNISEYQKQKLLDIGFSFDPLEDEWNRRYEQYKRYIAEKGNVYISRRTDFEGEHLGAWVETQRKRHIAGNLTCERTKKLLEIAPGLFDKDYQN